MVSNVMVVGFGSVSFRRSVTVLVSCCIPVGLRRVMLFLLGVSCGDGVVCGLGDLGGELLISMVIGSMSLSSN